MISGTTLFGKFGLVATLASIVGSLSASTQTLQLAKFSAGVLQGWEEKSFVGKTDYKLVQHDGRQVLRANTQGTASILYIEKKIDLTKTPWINWSWKISNTYSGLNEQTKKGDDYPARIYAIIKTGFFPWQTHALNYVWSSTTPKNESWKNAYTGNARMIAVESGPENEGTWKQEKRDIREDYYQQFGKRIDRIDGIAIMVDSDDSGLQATSYFGDIYFTDQ